MRICVTGTGCQGKSTFIEDFLKEWPDYKTPENTYRSYVKDTHSKKGTKEMQWKILDDMAGELQKYDSDDKIIFDRGPLDNLAYTIYLMENNLGGVDEDFVRKSMELCKQTFKFIDIIFFIPITRHADDIAIDNEDFLKNKEKGLTDETFRAEIDAILKACKYDWDVNMASELFDPHDKPAIIEIFGNPIERVQMAKLYLNVDGDSIDGDINNILTEAELMQQQQLKQEFGIEDKTTDEIMQNPTGYQ
mgnify:CR=1 FL=1